MQCVVQPRDRLRAVAQHRMSRDRQHLLAVDEHFAAVVDAGEIMGGGEHAIFIRDVELQCGNCALTHMRPYQFAELRLAAVVCQIDGRSEEIEQSEQRHDVGNRHELRQ
jgi:hypothetical protein